MVDKKFECQYCNRELKTKTAKISHEKKCEHNPNSPAAQKKITTLKDAEEELKELQKQDLTPEQKQEVEEINKQIPEAAPVIPIKLQPAIVDTAKIEELKQSVQEQQYDAVREKSYQELLQSNREQEALKKAIKNEIDLKKLTAGEDPVDKLLKMQQLRMFSNIGGQDSSQNQLLFQLQAQHYGEAMANQKQMFEMQQENQRQLFEFQKAQLELTKKEKEEKNTLLKELSQVKDVAKAMGWSADKSSATSTEYVMGVVGELAKHGLPLLKEMAEKRHQQPQYSEISQSIPNPEVEEQSLEGAGFTIPSPQPSGVPSLAPIHLSEEEIQNYAATHDLSDYGVGENINSDYINQYLHKGKFKK